jgi:thioredoxin-like negative regulator of GroEL
MSARTTVSPRRRAEGTQPRTKSRAARTGKPILLFFTRSTSGPARRMQSLIAWIKVTQRKRLEVVEVDVDNHHDLAERLHVADVPTLVLVANGRAVERIDGRATGHQIDRMIGPYLP